MNSLSVSVQIDFQINGICSISLMHYITIQGLANSQQSDRLDLHLIGQTAWIF